MQKMKILLRIMMGMSGVVFELSTRRSPRKFRTLMWILLN